MFEQNPSIQGGKTFDRMPAYIKEYQNEEHHHSVRSVRASADGCGGFGRDLENTAFAMFLRPRRFGKSLLISILQSYYDVNMVLCADLRS